VPTYLVLLRGVNVGKAKRVPMADFKSLLLGLGCSAATTLLNSGNAVVVAPKTTPGALAKTIAEAMIRRFGFEVPVVVKSADELNAIVEDNTLAPLEEHHSRFLVVFAQTADPLARLQGLEDAVQPPERLLLGAHAAYLYCANGILESKAAEAVLGKSGKAVTTRNWATVLKLHALANQGGASTTPAPGRRARP
jgi:uncharacterized protein (DUF1697 family)